MIWGMTLEPGQAQTEVIVGEIQLSMATMESRGCLGAKSDSFSHVVMRTSTAEYLLCTLVSGVTYQQNLDLKLMPNDKVTFSVQGTNVVYLTGYSYMPSEVMMDEAEAGVQADDWIEEANLDASVPRDDSGDFSGMDASYFPAMNQEDRHPHEREDEEKYSVEYSEDRDQYQPETDERVQTSDSSGNMMDRSLTSESKQTTQEPIDNAGVELVDVKEEIHTIADTTEDEPTQQIEREDRGQTINLPSTSTGQIGSTGFITTTRYPHAANSSRHLGHTTGAALIHKSQSTNVSNLESCKRYRSHGDTLQVIQTTPPHDQMSIRGDRQTSTSVSDHVTLAGRSATSVARPYLRRADRQTEKPYPCQYCGLSFKQPCYLRCHERIHTGEKPYQCKFCPKTFRLSNFLRQHMMTHTGERPYSCDYCSKRFRQKPHLKDHEKTHKR
ncbi:uncharacterized protein [Apostichopus japonicus]|uniref:uncharacterized protein isoform X6 n=1 Tax=Stichopus japonicus TaxID=307972 RepID=UPI003AB1E614